MSDNQIFQEQQSSRVEGMSKQLGFDIPVELVSLPSQGKLYPPDHPFANEEGAEVRSMTAREEDLLTSPALHKSGQVMVKLIEACLVNKSVNVGTLLKGDREALLIAIRIIGYGSEYKVNMPCPKCDEKFDNNFELNRLPLKNLEHDPIEPGVNRFAYTLPLSKVPVEFKLLTCADEQEMAQQEERRRKVAAQAEGRITSWLFNSILSINGIEDRGKIATIVNNLRAGDSRALRKHINKVEPRVQMVQDVKCPHCGQTSEVDVPLVGSFFWPDIE